jgi:hypothetical protein
VPELLLAADQFPSLFQWRPRTLFAAARWPPNSVLKPAYSAARRKLVVPVAVFGLDLSVATVDDQLGLLIAGNFSPPVDGLLLGVENPGVAFGAGSADGPPTVSGDDMLITLAHFLPPRQSLYTSICAVAAAAADNSVACPRLRNRPHTH